LHFEPGEAWKVIQYPGDLIYVPGEWAHSVLNKSPGIAFTENFINDSNYETVKRAAEASSDEDFLRILGFVRAIHARVSGRRIEPSAAAVP
jgi:oxalate decarboxylase/phosphoglucose isomerase-like protein (cupin superfamily)